MPVIHASEAPTFSMAGVEFTGLAAPSRGAHETCVWRLTIAAGTEGTPHELDRAEVIVALAGRAVASLGADRIEFSEGDALIVPPHVTFALANPHGAPFEAVAVLPVGGSATLAGGERFTPPWAT